MNNTTLKKSEQTKQKILIAAKNLFTYRNYDQVGLREIAKEAGVDVALISRYFGGKKQLYQQVINLVYKSSSSGERSNTSMFMNQDIGRLLANHMISMQDNQVYAERNNLFLQSISNETTAEIIGPQFYDCFVRQIELAITTGNAKMKAELITSLVIGGSSIFTLFKRNIKEDYDIDQFINNFASMINSILLSP